MYNRYIRNDKGVYTRVPQAEFPAAPPPNHSPSTSPVLQHETTAHHPPQEKEPAKSRTAQSGKAEQISDTLSSFLRHTLNQLRLDQVDTGDLLLLGLLFFLFREDADEELLVALGLLLIL